MHRPVIQLSLVSLLLAASPSPASTPLFEADDLVDIELSGPIASLVEDQPGAQRRFDLTTGATIRAVQVEAIGKSRRRVCSLPPLALRFVADSATDTVTDEFSGQQFLRMVTHCRPSREASANVLEEYLAFRILNLLTDYSFRVRLLRVTYIDTERPGTQNSAYAFAVESEYDLARRIDGELLAVRGLPKSRLNEEHAAIVYIFQYLIGNTDWSLVTGEGDRHCCHNGQLVDRGDDILYIPYDFDLSGLVNPRYARPDPSLRIRKVTTRLYRGYCGPPQALRAALQHVSDRRDAILNVYRSVPGLPEKDRTKGIRYIESFFRKAKNPDKLLEMFARKCLG